MGTIALKSSHKLVKAYYAALEQFVNLGAVTDSFSVQDQAGLKITNADQLANIRGSLESALNLLPG
jgi:hypothetical protein